MSSFRIFSFPYEFDSILFTKLIIDAGISANKERWIIFEMANDLRTTILPSIVNFLSFHNFNFFLFLTICDSKFNLFKLFILGKVNT